MGRAHKIWAAYYKSKSCGKGIIARRQILLTFVTDATRTPFSYWCVCTRHRQSKEGLCVRCKSKDTRHHEAETLVTGSTASPRTQGQFRGRNTLQDLNAWGIDDIRKRNDYPAHNCNIIAGTSPPRSRARLRQMRCLCHLLADLWWTKRSLVGTKLPTSFPSCLSISSCFTPLYCVFQGYSLKCLLTDRGTKVGP